MNSQYTFFWSGPFSQWHKSKFVVDGVEFNTAEQFMMYSKALLFNDIVIADEILATSNPKIQKSLGRQVSNFDPVEWRKQAKAIVYRGNYAKFMQNEHLKQQLFATKGTMLVEASPYDKIWGIGLNETAASRTPPNQWPGTNWLGEVLTYVRDDLLTFEV